MEDNIKTYKSAKLGIFKGHSNDSNLGFSNSENGGDFIHSYVGGPNKGYHEPGTKNRPVFGVNSDTYFLGNHKYPSPIQKLPNNSIYDISSISGKHSIIQGFGWGQKTLYPIVISPSELSSESDNKQIKKNKK